jgi:hypothetical protein
MTSGCSDFPTADNSASFVGVHAVLNPNLARQEVYVSRAFNLDAYEEYIPDTLKVHESGAIVIVRKDTQSVRFTEVAPGYYQDTAGVLKVVPGKTYELEVTTAQDEKITGSTIVPSNVVLINPTTMDTLSIDIGRDSAKGGIQFMNDPLLFEWDNTSQEEVFYFNIGGNDFTWLTRQSFVEEPRVVLFENPNWPYDGNWFWNGPIPGGDMTIEENMFIQIYSFDFSITNDSKKRITSNLKGGFGYFSSMNISRKAIYIRLVGIYVQNQ